MRPIRSFRTFLVLTAVLAALPAAADGRSLTISGRVLGPDGVPHPQAEVALEPMPTTYERLRLLLDGEVGAPPAARTRTDADGLFTLEAPGAGMWRVVVEVDGFLAMMHDIEPLLADVGLPVLRLERARELEVRVQGADGAPLPARALVHGLGLSGFRWMPRPRLARTEDGTLRVPRGKNEHGWIGVLTPGRPVAVEEIEAGRTTVTFRFEAPATGTLRVIDGRRRGVAGGVAGVVVTPGGGLSYGVSDAGGRLRGVPVGGGVALLAADGRSATATLDPAKRQPGGEEPVLTVQLDPPRVVEGRAIDLRDGKPVAGARVWRDPGTVAVADAAGRYRIALPSLGEVSLTAAAKGYWTRYGARPEAGAETLTLELDPAAGLIGRVVDAGGRPLAGVEVFVEWFSGRETSRPALGWQRELSTDREGIFHAGPLIARPGYRLRFAKGGYAPAILELDPLEPKYYVGFEAVLRPGQRGVGRVVDPDAAPVAGAEVELTPAARAHENPSWWDDDRPRLLTADDGRFEVPDLVSGRYRLTVAARGFAPLEVDGLEIGETASTDLGIFTLTPGAVLEGRVEDPAGRPVAGAEAWIDLGRVSRLLTRRETVVRATDRAGRFVFEDLPPGEEIGLTVRKRGFVPTDRITVAVPAAEPVTVVLAPAGRVTGTVLGPDREPVAGAEVEIGPDDPDERARRGSRDRTDAEGRFALEDVPAGTVALTVRAPAYLEYRLADHEVTPGEPDDPLEIVLERGAVVHGTLTAAGGEPVPGASVRVLSRQETRRGDLRPGSEVQTDAEGGFRVEGVPPGPASVIARRGKHHHVERKIEVRPGDQRVDLVFGPGYTVSGRVVDGGGRPVADARVGLQPLGYLADADEATTDDGRFTYHDVPAGRYEVAAWRRGFAAATSDPFEVDDRDVEGVVVEMGPGITLTGNVFGLEPEALASVEVEATSVSARWRGRVDRSGGYRIEHLSPGSWNVKARHPASGRAAAARITLTEDDDEATLDLEFTAGFTLSGTAFENDQPLAGARVVASGEGSGRSGTVGADGGFEIEDVPAGRYQLWLDGRDTPSYSEWLRIDGDREIHIDLTTARVAGTVRDARDREPLAGVEVTLLGTEAGDGLPGVGAFGGKTETDAQGRFALPRVREGRWRMTLAREGYAPVEQDFEILAGDAGEELELAMQPTEGVFFRPVLTTGEVPEYVSATVTDATGDRVLASDFYSVLESGRVHLSTVPEGVWMLRVQGGGSAVLELPVDAPGDLGQLVLPPGGTLEVTVPALRDAFGLPRVFLTDQAGRPYRAPGLPRHADRALWPVLAGSATLDGLPPGTWVVTVHEPGGRTWTATATVTAGEVSKVTIP